MNIDSIIAKVEKRIAKDTVLRQKLLGAKKLIGQVLEPEVLAARAGAPAAQKAKNSAAKSKSKEKTTAKPGSPAIGLHRRDGKPKPAAGKDKVKKGQITPAGRKRIAAAQRKRWAAAKKVLPARAGAPKAQEPETRKGKAQPQRPPRNRTKSRPAVLKAFHAPQQGPGDPAAENSAATPGQRELDEQLARTEAEAENPNRSTVVERAEDWE